IVVFKILFIAGLVAVLIFFIVRRLGMLGKPTTPSAYISPSDWIKIGMDNRSLRAVVKQTMVTVFIGFILLIIILIITAKFRLALIMLPISLYLIGQYFVLMNQIKLSRSLQLFYNPSTQDCKVLNSEGSAFTFNLDTDQMQVNAVKAVQKNNGLLLGYYTVKLTDRELVIPFILNQNSMNMNLFSKLDQLAKTGVSKLFPIH